MAMTKKAVFEAKRGVIHRINQLKAMDDATLLAEVKRAWPAVASATREEQLTLLIKDCIDLAFPDHLLQ